MRILHVVPSLINGGLEHMVLDFTRLGLEAGHEIDVLCLEERGVLAPQVEGAGGRVHCFHKPPGFWLKELDGMRKTLFGIAPDVIHSHYVGGLYYTGPPARKLGFEAIIHTEHGAHFANGWRSRLVGRLAFRHARRLVCVSNDTAAHLLHHHVTRKNKIRVVYNGIDVPRFSAARSERNQIRAELGIPRSAYVIGTLGRLADVKRQDVLIRAFAHVRQNNPDSRLLLIGDGPNRQQLTDLATSLGLDGDVIFAGYCPDRERYLAAMDLFALTSDSEGTPLSLLEAWAVGLPAVVTSVGGLPELIEDGVTGVLVPPGDSDAFAVALIRVATSHQLQTDLVKASHELVRSRFDREVMLEQYMSIYQDVTC